MAQLYLEVRDFATGHKASYKQYLSGWHRASRARTAERTLKSSVQALRPRLSLSPLDTTFSLLGMVNFCTTKLAAAELLNVELEKISNREDLGSTAVNCGVS